MYNTKSLKEKYRIKELNGYRFNECEVCGVNEPLKSINIPITTEPRKSCVIGVLIILMEQPFGRTVMLSCMDFHHTH